MDKSRNLAEQMRPFLKAMEQSIDSVRRQRLGDVENEQAVPESSRRDSPPSDQPPSTPQQSATTNDSFFAQPTPESAPMDRFQPRVEPEQDLGDRRPLSYDGSGVQANEDDDPDRPRMKARPKRSASFTHPENENQPPRDLHSRAG